MPNKTQECLNLAQQTAKKLTRYWENWTDYLTTASRLYKYSFADQLMIYAQRPDATACASFDIWNNRMNRYVRRGSKGIALLDQSSSVPRLHYVFDVSDTGVRRNFQKSELRFFISKNLLWGGFLQCQHLTDAISEHSRMTLDYFYGQAGELFSFYRIPNWKGYSLRMSTPPHVPVPWTPTTPPRWWFALFMMQSKK